MRLIPPRTPYIALTIVQQLFAYSDASLLLLFVAPLRFRPIFFQKLLAVFGQRRIHAAAPLIPTQEFV